MENPPRSRAIYALLAIPFVALAWVPFYDKVEPSFFGVPFFYWYQFLWVILTTVLTYIVYAATHPGRGR